MFPLARHSPVHASGGAHAAVHLVRASPELRIALVSMVCTVTFGGGGGGSSHEQRDITEAFTVRQPPFHTAGATHSFGHFAEASFWSYSGPASSSRTAPRGAGGGGGGGDGGGAGAGSAQPHTDITLGLVVRQVPFHFVGGLHTVGHFCSASV